MCRVCLKVTLSLCLLGLLVASATAGRAQTESTLYLPLVRHDEAPVVGTGILEEGPNPTSISMTPGAPTAVPGLENCVAIGYDYLLAETDHDVLFMVVTCEELSVPEYAFGNRAYLARVPHDTGLAGAELLRVPLVDVLAGSDYRRVRLIGSLKAEPIIENDEITGWTILSAMLNKVRENHSTLFLSSITKSDVDAYLNTGTEFTFTFGAESAQIASGTMVNMGHRPEARLTFQETYYAFLIACGKDIEQTVDHSSCYHSLLVPKATPLALETHIMVKGRLADGSWDVLADPWGAGAVERDALDDANEDADDPDPPSLAVPFKGTFVGRSGRTNIWQGGAQCLPFNEVVCLVFDSKGPARWHKDLEEVPEDAGYLAYAVAGPGLPAVNAGEITVGAEYGTNPLIADFAGGLTAVPYVRPVKDENGALLGYAIDMWSSTDYAIHTSPVQVIVGY